ncbi:hypothetical protein [Hymenobacter koreensis]|uniref:DUF3347 domain-containing protein n=1 Tax=Hymenobacter koreensis TaxID=1084523 RepID=A0ABP8JL59_9BACT
MHRFILVLAVALAPLLTSAQNTKPAPTPALAKFEGDMTASLCKEFEKENAVRPLAEFSKDQAQTFMQGLMKDYITAREKEVTKLFKDNGGVSNATMEAMGRRVGMRLASECPVAMVLFVRLAGGSTDVPASSLTISDAERPLLNDMADGVCQRLEQSNKQKPLTSLPKADRMALVTQTMQEVMKSNAKRISDQYGPEIFMDPEKLKAMGMKVGGIMATKCVTVLTAVGQE